jgi:hypothetical protein
MKKRLVALIVAGLLMGVTAIVAHAATLRLKDGRVLQGTYLGGTKDQVQFLINGAVKIYNTSQVASITFVTPAQEASLTSGAPLTQAVTVPQGTEIMIRMIDSVDSNVNRPGDIFHASLAQPLQIGNVVVARQDADVYGKLISVKSAGRLAGKSELALELTGIRTVNGTIQPIVTGEYQAVGKSRTKQTVVHSVIGAALGAVIGGIAGGGGGAAAGAGVGAAAGTGVTLITHGQQIKIPSETLLKFQLSQPFMITVAKQSQ